MEHARVATKGRGLHRGIRDSWPRELENGDLRRGDGLLRSLAGTLRTSPIGAGTEVNRIRHRAGIPAPRAPRQGGVPGPFGVNSIPKTIRAGDGKSSASLPGAPRSGCWPRSMSRKTANRATRERSVPTRREVSGRQSFARQSTPPRTMACSHGGTDECGSAVEYGEALYSPRPSHPLTRGGRTPRRC